MSSPINDIFISYRRDGGSELAQLVYKDLKKRGYRVFMDVRELRSGHFDDELRRQVGAAKDFLLLLTPNCLDRCVDPGDWVRSEIALALQLKLNIVPLVKPPFRIPNPQDLPPELAELPRHNAVEYNHDKSDESLAIAASRLRSKSSWLRANSGRLLAGSLGLATVLAALGVWVGFADLGKRAEKTQQTTAEIKDATSNILESTVAVQQDASTIKKGISELADKTDKQAGAFGQQLDEISIAIREQIGGGNLGSDYDKVNFHRDYQDEYLKKGGQLSSLLSEYNMKASEYPQNAMYQYLLARLYQKAGGIAEARSIALKGYEADKQFMWNRRMLLYECMPEKISLENMLSIEAEHYGMTDAECSAFSNGNLKEALVALSNIRERLKNDPLLYEELSPQKLHSWHFFKLLTSKPYSRSDAFSNLIGKTSVSTKGLIKLNVLDVKKGIPAIEILSKGKSIKIWNENEQSYRENIRGDFSISDTLNFPPIAVLVSVKNLSNEVDMRTFKNRRFSLLGYPAPLPMELATYYTKLANTETDILRPSVYDSDTEKLEKNQEFWIVFFGLPFYSNNNLNSLLKLSFQVNYGFNNGDDLIGISDGVLLSSIDSLNAQTALTNFSKFEENFRLASVQPRSKLQTSGIKIETPFDATVTRTSGKEISGIYLNAYGLEDRKIRLLFDPKNRFYGPDMTNFIDIYPKSDVIDLLDNLKDGQVIYLNGTVIDKDNGELLMIPAMLNEHPNTISSVENTAVQLYNQGDYSGAKVLFRRALSAYENVYGPEHPEAILAAGNLALVLGEEKSDLSESESLCRRALTGFEKVLGPEHPHTIRFIKNHADQLFKQGSYSGAEASLRRILPASEKIFGKEDQVTLDIINKLAMTLKRSNRRSEALELLRTRAALSDQTEDGVRYNLACYECLEGNLNESKRLVKKHIEINPKFKKLALEDPDFTAIRDFIEAL